MSMSAAAVRAWGPPPPPPADVHQALIDLIGRHGGNNAEQARAVVDQLQSD